MKERESIFDKTPLQHAISHLNTIMGCAILYTGGLILMSKMFTHMI